MKVIVTSDWHIRASAPVSRLESGFNQWWSSVLLPKLEFILDQGLPIWHVGDVFDTPRFVSLPILNWLRSNLKDITVIPGNHDLLGYQWNDLASTPYFNVFGNSKLPTDFVIQGVHSQTPGDSDVLFYHGPVFKDSIPFYMEGGVTADQLMDKYPQYKIYITGDNHSTFIHCKHTKLLINPGSLCRLTVSQKDFKPLVYVLDTETLECEPLQLPIKQEVWRETPEPVDFKGVTSEFKNLSSDTPLGFSEIMTIVLRDQPKNIRRRIESWM